MCGIAGIVTKTPRKFDYTTFCTLGIANDTRGGDSCGVFIDGEYEYGVKDKKLFQDYFIENEWLQSIKKSMIAFVHCRKASVGIINEKTAQPVIIEENNVVKYVLMHNGTIHNYKELAKKYIPNVDITGMTDSQVMAHIFYYAGYDSLKEYEGGAVFVIADYREKVPKVLLFKGASKKYKTSQVIEEERPLYYCIDPHKGELVFSSIDTYLFALRRYLTIYIVPENILMEFDGKDLIIVVEYDRSNLVQVKKVKNYFRYFGLYDDFGYTDYSNYISINYLNNTYSINGKAIHGIKHLSKLGEVKVVAGLDTTPIWFFLGVALKNGECFNFLTNFQSKLNMSDKDFSKKFENVIRYLSIDGIYCKDILWYRAISPETSIPFTGTLKAITSTTQINFVNGVKKNSFFCSGGNYMPTNIDSKDVLSQCKYLMK